MANCLPFFFFSAKLEFAVGMDETSKLRILFWENKKII